MVGRLYTEGLIEAPDEILGLHICKKGLEAKVLLPEDSVSCLRREDAETVSSCCTDNRVLFAGAEWALPHFSPIPWRGEQVRTLAEQALRDAPLYQATQAVHSCALGRPLRVIAYYPSDAYLSSLGAADSARRIGEIDCRDLFDGSDPRERLVIYETSSGPDDE